MNEQPAAESSTGQKNNVADASGIGGSHVQFLELLGIRPTRLSQARVVFEVNIDERHLRTLGIAHGGVTATLIDTAAGFAAGTTAPQGHHLVTVQLNLNYVRPAWEGETLVATGEVVHAGKQTAVSRAEIRNSNGVLVATGSATFMYIPEPTTADHKMPKLDTPPR